MLLNTTIAKNWHFSGEKEPVDCLYELEPGESDEARDSAIERLAQDSLFRERHRMDESFKVNEGHLELILSVHKKATEEWLNCWEDTWKTIFTETLSEIHQHAFTLTDGDSREITCRACGHTWATWRDFDDQARDHVLANCPEALNGIEMAITKCPNLMLLPFTPSGNMWRSTSTTWARCLRVGGAIPVNGKWRRSSTLDATPSSRQTFRCTRPRTDFPWFQRHRHHLQEKTHSHQTLTRRNGSICGA